MLLRHLRKRSLEVCMGGSQVRAHTCLTPAPPPVLIRHHEVLICNSLSYRGEAWLSSPNTYAPNSSPVPCTQRGFTVKVHPHGNPTRYPEYSTRVHAVCLSLRGPAEHTTFYEGTQGNFSLLQPPPPRCTHALHRKCSQAPVRVLEAAFRVPLPHTLLFA